MIVLFQLLGQTGRGEDTCATLREQGRSLWTLVSDLAAKVTYIVEWLGFVVFPVLWISWEGQQYTNLW